MLKGKNIVLGVCSSIACYKSAILARLLTKMGANVQVIMTKNATNLVNPITFEQLTSHRCLVDTFERSTEIKVEHISLADWADAFIVAPASANTIAKMAHGIADDMLTTTFLACTCPKIVVPAMNMRMYENPVTQENLAALRRFGYILVEPAEGLLACGDIGKGKMEEPDVIIEYVERIIACEKDLLGKKILVTAGPTREALDPVRFLSNHSTGRMGYALAKMAVQRGAQVTLVTGKTDTPKPRFVDLNEVVSAKEMYDAVMLHAKEQDVIIMAAAVADYRPKTVAAEKIKKADDDTVLELERTDDILATVGANRQSGQFICGFSMETENILENSRKKLEKKKIDMIIANDLKQEGAGFGVDTNVVTIITKQEERQLPRMSKEDVADKILDAILVCCPVDIYDN